MAIDTSASRPRVAVVGSGLAGLATAYLLRRSGKYDVDVLEASDTTGLANAVFTAPDSTTIALPTISFSPRYSTSLSALYAHLGLPITTNHPRIRFFTSPAPFKEKPPYPPQPRALPTPARPPGYTRRPFIICGPHMTYPGSSNSPSGYFGRGWMDFCHLQSCIALWSLPPQPHETLADYLARVGVAWQWTATYLLPLMAFLTRVPHDHLLRFPADDVVTYMRALGEPPAATLAPEGVRQLSELLTEGVGRRFKHRVLQVVPEESGVAVQWEEVMESSPDGIVIEEPRRWRRYDYVVLAVPPDAVARIYPRLADQMAKIPSRTVEVVASHIPPQETATDSEKGDKDPEKRERLEQFQQLVTEKMAESMVELRTVEDTTEATRYHPGRIAVTTAPMFPIRDLGYHESRVLAARKFTQVMRTVESKAVVEKLMGLSGTDGDREDMCAWRNGDEGVFLAGGWCWDGMVGQEGCVRSAEAVACALEVEVP